jgi:predicted NUDIX family NTP pyrophosphohydrolase
MPKKTAGLLLFRETQGRLEVLLVHPGGPFWARKDDGAWSIPKGLLEENEDAWAAAKREFMEETGGTVPDGEPMRLDPLRQAGGKIVYAYAMRGDFDPTTLKSNTFLMEWPPKSGKQQEFPEVDRAGWFTLEIAQVKILQAQAPLLRQLLERVRNLHGRSR